MHGFFAPMRRAGFDAGISIGKLTKAMVEVLFRLPPQATPSKEAVVARLGLLGQMTKTRDINAAWNRAKRQAAQEFPDRFWLDGKVPRRASDMDGRPRAKLSTAGHRKLTTLAAKEGLTPDEFLNRLISPGPPPRRGSTRRGRAPDRSDGRPPARSRIAPARFGRRGTAFDVAGGPPAQGASRGSRKA
ncbi:MAG: hypothetical protein HY716_04635 [Planctomycetes bacterium]|nr:hypothetical protein [Planctomycetota bacterium]